MTKVASILCKFTFPYNKIFCHEFALYKKLNLHYCSAYFKCSACYFNRLFTEILQSGIDFKVIKCTEDGMWHPLHDKEEKNDLPSPVIQSIEG